MKDFESFKAPTKDWYSLLDMKGYAGVKEEEVACVIKRNIVSPKSSIMYEMRIINQVIHYDFNTFIAVMRYKGYYYNSIKQVFIKKLLTDRMIFDIGK